jgi:hypothetical protein
MRIALGRERSRPRAFFKPHHQREKEMKLTKMLGTALAAVLALSAFAASAASAVEFKATNGPVNLRAGQDTTHTLTLDGSAVTCGTTTFEANGVIAPSKTVTVTPAYSGCTAFGFITQKIEMNGCRYEFLQPNGSLVGNLALRCPKEARVRLFTTFLGSQCEVFFGEAGNTNLEKVTYKNEMTSPTTVKVTAAVTGITAEKTKDTGICPLKGTGTVNTAEYSGISTVEGGGGIGISVG